MLSRLANREQKKLAQQTVLFLVGAVVVIALAIWVIIPGFLRLVAGFNTGIENTAPDDTLPPQVPILAAPVTATPSATLKLTGYGEVKSQIVLVVNGSEQSRQTAGDDGSFSFDLQLQKGDNVVTAYAIDQSQNESSSSKAYTIVMDDQPPKLEILEPQGDQQFETRKNQVIIIKGMSDKGARITINGRMVMTKEDGSFSTTYQLQEGDNKLTFQAEDSAGNRAQQELVVKFRL